MLSVNCGCDIRVINLGERAEEFEIQYLIKIRINKDSILHFASKSETQLNLK